MAGPALRGLPKSIRDSAASLHSELGTARHWATLETSKNGPDVHLPALTIIIRHYATLGTANFYAGGCEDQLRGGLGGLVGELGQHAGVGVGGEHDAGVAEHRLHGVRREALRCIPGAAGRNSEGGSWIA